VGQRIGDTKLEFGSTDETWGLVQTISKETSVEEADARKGNNDIAAVQQTNEVQAVSGTYLYRAELVGSAPLALVGSGTAITLQTSGTSIYIKSATEDWSFNGWKSVSFEGTRWPNLNS